MLRPVGLAEGVSHDRLAGFRGRALDFRGAAEESGADDQSKSQ